MCMIKYWWNGSWVKCTEAGREHIHFLCRCRSSLTDFIALRSRGYIQKALGTLRPRKAFVRQPVCAVGAIFTKPSELCHHANLAIVWPKHRIVHWLPNSRFARPQSCEGFVDIVPGTGWTRTVCPAFKFSFSFSIERFEWKKRNSACQYEHSLKNRCVLDNCIRT
jgi:hypothetical protein